jgi:hypothetical protein
MSINATKTTEAPKTEAPKTEAPKTEAPKTEAPKTEAPKTEAPKAPSVFKQVTAILDGATADDIVSVCAAAIAAHFKAAGIPVSGATVRAINPLSGSVDYSTVSAAWSAAKAEDAKQVLGAMDRDDAKIARSLMAGMGALDNAHKLGINVALSALRALELGAREGDALIVQSAIATKAIRKATPLG